MRWFVIGSSRRLRGPRSAPPSKGKSALSRRGGYHDSVLSSTTFSRAPRRTSRSSRRSFSAASASRSHGPSPAASTSWTSRSARTRSSRRRGSSAHRFFSAHLRSRGGSEPDDDRGQTPARRRWPARRRAHRRDVARGARPRRARCYRRRAPRAVVGRAGHRRRHRRAPRRGALAMADGRRRPAARRLPALEKLAYDVIERPRAALPAT